MSKNDKTECLTVEQFIEAFNYSDYYNDYYNKNIKVDCEREMENIGLLKFFQERKNDETLSAIPGTWNPEPGT